NAIWTTPLVLSLAGEREGGLVGEGRHDVARKLPDVLARTAKIDDHVFDAAAAQPIELAHDLVRGAEQGALRALVPGLRLVRLEALARVAAGAPRQRIDPHMALVAPLERCLLIGLVLGDVDSARHRHLHRVEPPAARPDLVAELRGL